MKYITIKCTYNDIKINNQNLYTETSMELLVHCIERTDEFNVHTEGSDGHTERETRARLFASLNEQIFCEPIC